MVKEVLEVNRKEDGSSPLSHKPFSFKSRWLCLWQELKCSLCSSNLRGWREHALKKGGRALKSYAHIEIGKGKPKGRRKSVVVMVTALAARGDRSGPTGESREQLGCGSSVVFP